MGPRAPCLSMLKHNHIRPIIFVLVLVVVAPIILWARAFYGSRQAYHRGEACFQRSQYVKAVTFFDRSVHWYTPFNPYIRKSVERLWEIAERAEQQGDIRLALIATRTIRRGFYAIRSVYLPGRAWIKRCDVKITKLMRTEQTHEELSSMAESPNKRRPVNQGRVSTSILWSVVVEIGFLGWIAAAIGFIIFASQDHRERRFSNLQAVAWGSMTIIFFFLWLVGMMKA